MQEIITSVRLVGVTMLICCAVYPWTVWQFARVAAPKQHEGSLIRDADGKVIGSSLIAQKFTRPEYVWPRPSAVDYDASATGGSNLSPLNPKIRARAKQLLVQLQRATDEKVPADLVTASGSGIDPHISLSAARFQAPRVATARGLQVQEVEELIDQHIDSPTLAALGGEPLVNVLQLNLALDKKGKR
jgi:K+-transporting ATPase ATPase C chain